MPAAVETSPYKKTVAPADQAELAAAVRDAAAAGTAVYPIGGGTALGYGLPVRQPGVGLSLSNLAGIIEYPARDMTITVEAGITIASLAETLAAEGQRLAVDAAQAERATLGGLIATNFSGPRRYGQGTMRDYVIGITAVDGRGVAFKGGGRVVKNVAGYDFCKLLTGSMGTLGVITQATLKLRPIPEATAFVLCDVLDWNQAETLLAALIHSQATPTAIELLAGPMWKDGTTAKGSANANGTTPASGGPVARLAVGLEGTATEVEWMIGRLQTEWSEQRASGIESCRDQGAGEFWGRLIEFPAQAGDGIVLKAAVTPSQAVRFIRQILEIDPQASLQSHAGNGIVLAHLPGVKPVDLAGLLVKRLQPAAVAAGGNIVVYSAPDESGLTRQAQWGTATADAALMRSVKEQFDPRGVLNPGRFIYGK